MSFLTSYIREEQAYVIIEMHVCRLRMYSYMKDPIIREQKCICNILLCEQGQGFRRFFYLFSSKSWITFSILFTQMKNKNYNYMSQVCSWSSQEYQAVLQTLFPSHGRKKLYLIFAMFKKAWKNKLWTELNTFLSI